MLIISHSCSKLTSILGKIIAIVLPASRYLLREKSPFGRTRKFLNVQDGKDNPKPYQIIYIVNATCGYERKKKCDNS